MLISSNDGIGLINMMGSRLPRFIREEIVEIQDRDSRRTNYGLPSGIVG
jgi:hypothetical protein